MAEPEETELETSDLICFVGCEFRDAEAVMAHGGQEISLYYER
jgi:hypothetical protein